MKNISIKGIPPIISRSEMLEAIDFFEKHLFTKQLAKNITLDVEFLVDFFKNSEYCAQCNYEDDDSPVPRWFTISIDSGLSKTKIFKNLAHEMVHVEQYATGRLKHPYKNDSNLNKWLTTVIDDRKIDYWDLPWEIEAYGKEVGLYVRFTEERKKAAKRKKFHGKGVGLSAVSSASGEG